jgi:lipopolysaccharide transport system ATP-binding protein
MNNVVIQVDRLSKEYRLGIIGRKRLVDDVNRWWARFRGKEDPLSKIGDRRSKIADSKRKIPSPNSQLPSAGSAPTPNSNLPSPQSSPSAISHPSERYWALKDVSFEVKQGEVLGIIGRNGAGKSTLLKILSRVTGPTSGEVRVKGRIASLLEVGTGFHPELTGRENVFLNGAILGMTKAEIRGKFDEIVAFSEIEQFIDTPVKRYSSGMYVRLAFAVAAHLEPEILIVDEVLAVGDVQFQKKCLGKMREVSEGGRTVLFVSHNIGAVANLCSKALFLKQGQINDFGPTTTVLEKYLSDSAKAGSDTDLDSHRLIRPTGARLKAITVSGKNGTRLSWGEPLRLIIEVETEEKTEGLFFGITLVNQKVETVGSCLFPDRFALKDKEKAIFSLGIATNDLSPGVYNLNVGLGRRGQQELADAVVGYPSFEVMPTSEAGIGVEVWHSSWGSISFRKIHFEKI